MFIVCRKISGKAKSAFAVTRYAQQKIHIFDAAISIEKMRSSLKGVQSSILEDTTTGLFYKAPSQANKETALIYRALEIQRIEDPSKYVLKSKYSSQKKLKLLNIKDKLKKLRKSGQEQKHL